MIRWLTRCKNGLNAELDKNNGLLALGGLILAFIGIVTGGVARLVLVIAGGAVAFLAVAPALVKAVPKKIRPVKDYDGQEISLADLHSLDPIPPSIGILGISEVGKTALKNYLLRHSQQQGRTQDITARITSTLEHPGTYVAVIDGPGDTHDQQFDIAAEAEVLIVMLDHNIVPGQSDIAPGRIQKHKEFGVQLRGISPVLMGQEGACPLSASAYTLE